MTKDLSILIDEQVEQLGAIEEGVDSMSGKIKQSHEKVQVAIVNLKAARRKKVQIAIILTVTGVCLVLIILCLMVYYTCDNFAGQTDCKKDPFA